MLGLAAKLHLDQFQSLIQSYALPRSTRESRPHLRSAPTPLIRQPWVGTVKGFLARASETKCAAVSCTFVNEANQVG